MTDAKLKWLLVGRPLIDNFHKRNGDWIKDAIMFNFKNVTTYGIKGAGDLTYELL